MAKIIRCDNVHKHIKILNLGSPNGDHVSSLDKNERVLISTRVLIILSVNLAPRLSERGRPLCSEGF